MEEKKSKRDEMLYEMAMIASKALAGDSYRAREIQGGLELLLGLAYDRGHAAGFAHGAGESAQPSATDIGVQRER